MAERPIFVPCLEGRRLVDVVPIAFRWHPGMSATQKKKNVIELHQNAERQKYYPLLEISSKSDYETGRRLSAFHQKLRINNIETTVECAFQGSKVFERGGPFTDMYEKTSREAKKDSRLRESGQLIGFLLDGKNYPLLPPTAFYDWLYMQAVYQHRKWLKEKIHIMAGFTDIEFNPERSVNCQARALAAFVALEKRGELDEAMQSFRHFVKTAYRDVI